MEERLDDRFGRKLDARLKLHAGLLQSGARAMARLSSFSERSEERWINLIQRVSEIERKLRNQ